MGTIMKRNSALKVLNPFLFVLFISQTATVLFHEHIPYKTFQIFHKGGGMVLLALISAHIIMNFNWIKANYFPKR